LLLGRIMDSARLLDLLGNENRRKILQLLAYRPCYVTEISDRLRLGAKAVLNHLELLREAGLIEDYTDEQRRKYFHVSDNIRLEFFVSPYSYGVEASTIMIKREPIENYSPDLETLTKLQERLWELEEEQKKLAQTQQAVQAKITEIMDACFKIIKEIAKDYFEREILFALLKKSQDSRALSINLGIPEYVVEEHLSALRDRGVIREHDNNYWSL